MADGRVLVPLLEGFEEIEAVTIIDVLRRAGVDVVTASDRAGPVRGSHAIEVVADAALDAVDVDSLAMIVLPGGMPGAAHLAEHAGVQRVLRALAESGRYTGAICAAPMALARSGAHVGRIVTCYPGFQSHLDGGEFVEDRVVVDGPVVTSRGPGTALEFALTLVGLLRGPEAEAKLQAGMLVQRAAPARVSDRSGGTTR